MPPYGSRQGLAAAVPLHDDPPPLPSSPSATMPITPKASSPHDDEDMMPSSTRSSSSLPPPPPLLTIPTLGPCFLLLALAYMAPFTVLGSLISYYKTQHGPDFFVKLNCAFYLPGLPWALAQQWCDPALDARFGSLRTYTARNVVAFGVLAGVLVVVPWTPPTDTLLLLGLTAVMGAASWLAHGTVTTLVIMFPPAAQAWLQTGFRMPEIYTLAMQAVLHLGRHPAPQDLRFLFHATALLVLVGGLGWLYLMGHKATKALLRLKDQGGHTLVHTTQDVQAFPSPQESAPLLATSSTRSTLSTLTTVAVTRSPTCTDSSSSSSSSSSFSLSSSTHPQHHPAMVRPLTEAEKDFVEAAIRPCRWTLFITIASSIFQASFLAYVNSSRPDPTGSYCVCELLYFVRLFADFAGRPLARLLPRPTCLQKPPQLVHAAVARLWLLALFWVYIGVPGFPQSDAFVATLVAVFALSSGMLVVLSYEYAARAVAYCKAYQAYAGSVMNLHFQAAAFLAVLAGLLFVDLGLCPKTNTLT